MRDPLRTVDNMYRSLRPGGVLLAHCPNYTIPLEVHFNVVLVTRFFSADGVGQITAACQSGEKAISGGFSSNGVVLQLESAPSSDGASWHLVVVNIGDSAASSTGYAVCVK